MSADYTLPNNTNTANSTSTTSYSNASDNRPLLSPRPPLLRHRWPSHIHLSSTIDYQTKLQQHEHGIAYRRTPVQQTPAQYTQGATAVEGRHCRDFQTARKTPQANKANNQDDNGSEGESDASSEILTEEAEVPGFKPNLKMGVLQVSSGAKADDGEDSDSNPVPGPWPD